MLDGHPAPVPEKGAEPTPLKFSAHVYCGQTAGWIKVALGTEVGLSPGDFVLDGDPAPLQKGGGPSPLPTKGAEPPLQFSANFYCAQTAGCITMPLGVEVGLSPGDFVFDGDPAPSRKRGIFKKGTQPPPQFSAHVYCGQRAGWIKMALDTEVVYRPKTVTRPGTNRARRRVTSLIRQTMLPLLID